MGSGPVQNVFDELSTEAAPAIVAFDDHVLKQHDTTPFGGTDGEQRIGHAGDFSFAAQDEQLPDHRILQNQVQAGKLLVAVGAEVTFEREQFGQQVGHRFQIVVGGKFDRCVHVGLSN